MNSALESQTPVLEREPNFLSGLSLDRAGARRRDEAWLKEIVVHPSTRFLPISGGSPLVLLGEQPEPLLLSTTDRELLYAESTLIFLGVSGSGALFAVEVEEGESTLAHVSRAEGAAFLDFRDIGPLLSREHGALLSYARSLSEWHARTRFCSRCGSLTAIDAAGHVRRCMSESCGTQHFPRTDPAVIMLVTSGNLCLLGRQPVWPPGMYSTLAGFVEGGESLEEAVRREVLEETGVEVDSVRYHSSQPWPFPSSLMIGFTAEARTTSIVIDHDELEDARWMTSAEIREQQEKGTIRLPRKVSIARRLIDEWMEEQEQSTSTPT